MLDGLVAIIPSFQTNRTPIYTRHERMLDVEKLSLYFPDAQVWTVLTYFDPRRDQEHKKPLRTYIHGLCTQFQNFLFSQLSLDEIEEKEIDLLSEYLEMQPSTLLFELVLGWWDTRSWQKIFPFFTTTVYSELPEDVKADDLVYIRRKVKIAKYPWNGIDFKFYRMNPDNNKNHMLKYPYGWAGYTKCEIPTPKFGDFRHPLTEEDLIEIGHALNNLQKIRETLIGPHWKSIQEQVAQKTYARNDRIYVWSSTEQPLQGSMTFFETELTERRKMSPKLYNEKLTALLSQLETNGEEKA